jgi:hypothetical protein
VYEITWMPRVEAKAGGWSWRMFSCRMILPVRREGMDRLPQMLLGEKRSGGETLSGCLRIFPKADRGLP